MLWRSFRRPSRTARLPRISHWQSQWHPGFALAESVPARLYSWSGKAIQARAAAHANLVVPGTGTGGVASAPNSYLGGLRSSLELRIISGVMISPV